MVAKRREAADAAAHATRDAGLIDGRMPDLDDDIAEPPDAEALGAGSARHLARRPAG